MRIGRRTSFYENQGKRYSRIELTLTAFLKACVSNVTRKVDYYETNSLSQGRRTRETEVRRFATCGCKQEQEEARQCSG
jgi:hypothetical protein